MQEGPGWLGLSPYTLCVPPCRRGPFRKFNIFCTKRLNEFGMLTSPLLLKVLDLAVKVKDSRLDLICVCHTQSV